MFRDFIYAWGPLVYNVISNTVSKIIYSSQVIYRELNTTNTWIFLKDATIPVSTRSFIDSGISDSYIHWRATTSPPVFRNPNASIDTRQLKHISFLSFEITIQDIQTFDISDWINDIMWNGSTEPSIKDIVTLWSCEKGICLFHIFDAIIISAISSTGECIKRGLNDTTPLYVDERGSKSIREDPNRIMDVILSSSGR